MPKKRDKKTPNSSPEKKRLRHNILDAASSDDEELHILPPTRISKNDPLVQSGLLVQDPKGVTDEEWEKVIDMSRKRIPGIRPMTPTTPARKRRQKLVNQLEGRRLFNDGIYKISRSPKKLDHEIFDQLISSNRQGI